MHAAPSLPLKPAALMLCLVLPWLFNYTSAPTLNWWPWFFSALCGLGVALAWGRVSAQWLAASWLAAALISCVIALVQYFGVSDHAWVAHWISQTPAGEAYGNLRQRNQFASLTSIGLAALLACVALRAPSAPGRLALPDIPAWAWAAALLLALGNAVSSSRTGLLQWVLLLALVLWWHRAGRRPLVLLTALALLAYLLALRAMPALLSVVTGMDGTDLFGRMAQSGSDSRIVLWGNVLTLIAQKPWFGWGWGELDYAHFMAAYPGPRFPELLGNAHNLPLHLAVELGLPVALIACAAVAAVVCAGKPWRETDAGRQLAWTVLAVIGLHSLLEYPLWYGPFQLAVLLCAAWLGSTRGAAVRASRPGRIKLGLATLAVLALAWAAADYWRVSQAFFVPASQRLASIWGGPQSPAKNSWLFAPQVAFAELVTTDVTPANAPALHALALRVLHYSPEPRVLEKLLDSARLAGLEGDMALYADRFARANPKEHARWLQKNAADLQPAAINAPSTAPASATSSR
jgi:O-antigen ligase